MKKKILLTYMESGMGHITSIKSISDALKQYSSKYEIIDSYIMQEDNNRTLINFENFIINQTKKTNKDKHYGDFVFFLITILGKQRFMRAVHHSIFNKALKQALISINKYKPDVIVSTHYFMTLCGIEYKRKYNKNCIVVTYNPDNNTHSWWDNRGGLFIVNNPNAYKEAITKQHFNPEKVKEVFFTTRQSIIDSNQTKHFYRKKYNIPLNKFCAIIADGIYASAMATKVCDELLKTDLPITIIMLAGKNQKVYEHYSKLKNLVKPNITLITMPFEPNIHEVYRASDIFITKSGPNAVLDSVFMQTPIIIDYFAHPIEKCTKRLFVDKFKCGEYIKNPIQIRTRIEQFIQKPELLNVYVQNCKKLDKNKNGAKDIAKYIVEEIENSDEKKTNN